MIEPAALTTARKHLSRAEATLFSAGALPELEDGFALLQEIQEVGPLESRKLAQAIGKTYAAKVYRAIRALIAADRNAPEPQLEHMLKLILTLDAADVELPNDAYETKIALGRELLNRYLEGHAAEEKRAALEALMRIAHGEATKSRCDEVAW